MRSVQPDKTTIRHMLADMPADASQRRDGDANPPRVERRRFLSWVLGAGALAAAEVLAGCGSGSRRIGVNGSSSGTGTVGGGTVSAVTRQAAFDAVDALLATLPGAGTAAENALIATLLASRPEFEETGVSEDGCAWGRFKDGRLLIVANNRPVPTSTAAAEARAARAHIADMANRANSAKHRAAGTGLPASTNVRFFETMGTAYSRPAAGLQSTVVAAPAHGYSSSTGGTLTGTVEQLKAVQGDGIFYIDAHGGTGYLRQSFDTGSDDTRRKVFAIWTGSQASALDEPAYKADLDSNRLCYMKAVGDLQNGKVTHPTRYAITELFVSAYMKFGANSLVYFDSCLSSADSTQSQNFKTACLAAGAGVYLGWSERTNDTDATLAAQFAFDRLLGSDTVAPVDTPAKPPLDWTALQSAMATTVKPGSSLTYDTSNQVEGHPQAKLRFTQGTSGDLGVLVPSITNITVDTTAQTITLTGIFGAAKGTAQSNVSSANASGSAVTVKSWSSTQVVLDLPTGCKTVRVLVDNRASNIVAVAGGAVQIAPKSVTIGVGDLQYFTVSTPGDQDDVVYDWSTTAATGSLTGDDGDSGKSFESGSDRVSLTTSSADAGTFLVSVTAYRVGTDGKRTEIGSDSATVKAVLPTAGSVGYKVLTFGQKAVFNPATNTYYKSYVVAGFLTYTSVPTALRYDLRSTFDLGSGPNEDASDIYQADIAQGTSAVLTEDKSIDSGGPYNPATFFRPTNSDEIYTSNTVQNLGNDSKGNAILGYFVANSGTGYNDTDSTDPDKQMAADKQLPQAIADVTAQLAVIAAGATLKIY